MADSGIIQFGALTAVPLTSATWDALATLFGSHGACGGCWCMTPRISVADYRQQKGEGNRQKLKAMVDGGEHLGIIAFRGSAPVGWCSVSPEDRLLSMKKSRLLRLTSTGGTWAIVCLYIRKESRGNGLSEFLVRSAVNYAFENGAAKVEAFPVGADKDRLPDAFAWQGFEQVYLRAGFSRVPGMPRPVVSIDRPGLASL